jgi:class 3 adenylate cyclase/tetratricopeptide (TPR) repeat protein
MNGAFSVMNEAVSYYGGTVARLMGDGILAFFGVPTTHEDDAERAVLAGLRLRNAAAEYGTRVMERRSRDDAGSLAFAVRVGVATGQSVLTTVGDDIMAEFTAMGETANLAARMQGLAEPGAVLIAADTYEHVRDSFETVPLGAKPIKGFASSVRVFEVLGPRSDGGRRRGVEGLVAPIVGREHELRLLRERVADVGRGVGGFVSLVGEAGLGKSRLIAELRSRARHERGGSSGALSWHEGRALSYAQAVPYFPLRAPLLAAIGATPTDDPAMVRERLATVFSADGGLEPDHERYLQLLLAVEDATVTAEVATLDGGVLSHRIAAAYAAYVAGLARHPTVLVFEDLHWADHATITLIAQLSELTLTKPLLILALMRPDRAAHSYELSAEVERRVGNRHVRVELKPLDAANVHELLVQLLGGGELPPALGRVAERSDGNPFYLEEVLRSLLGSGHLTLADGRWEVSGDLTNLDLPETLSGVLGARIDRLPKETRRVAQTAAVIGRIFERTVLGEVLAQAPAPIRGDDVDPHLETLTDEELVRELRPLEEYAFKHVLTQEAAYERLLTRRRVELHRLVAQVLERLYTGRLHEISATLASHYERAHEWLAFAEHAKHASLRARRLNALDEALDLDRRMVAALDRVDDAHRDSQWRRTFSRALVGLTETEMLMKLHEDPSQRQGMIDRSRRAVELARTEDDELLVRALVHHANVYVLSGFPTEGFELLIEGHDLAQRLGDDNLFLLPFWAVTEKSMSDDPVTAAQRLGEVAALAETVGDKAVRSHALGSRALALARLGRFREAIETMPVALEVAYASGSTIKEADVSMLVGAALMEMDELDTAMRFIQHGRDKALEINGRECAANGMWLSGQGNMTRMQLSAALEEFDLALAVAANTEFEPLLYGVEASKAACRFRVGDRGAVTDLNTQLERAESMRDDYGRWTAAHLLGTSLLDSGRPEEALVHLEGALAWFRDRQMLPYVMRTLRDGARAHRQVGNESAAVAAEQEADAIGERLKGPFDLGALGEPGRPPLVAA